MKGFVVAVCLAVAVATAMPAAAQVFQHYQEEINLDCSGQFCTGDYPAMGTNRRVQLTRISCLLFASAGSEFRNGTIELVDSTGTLLMHQFLPADRTTTTGVHTLNQEINLLVRPTEHARAVLALATGTAATAQCTVTGVREILR